MKNQTSKLFNWSVSIIVVGLLTFIGYELYQNRKAHEKARKEAAEDKRLEEYDEFLRRERIRHALMEARREAQQRATRNLEDF